MCVTFGSPIVYKHVELAQWGIALQKIYVLFNCSGTNAFHKVRGVCLLLLGHPLHTIIHELMHS